MSDCERIRDGVLAQPVNAVTSLAYGAAAAGMIPLAKRSRGRHRVAFIGYGASLAAVSLGSVAYHGPQPRWARNVHDTSIMAAFAGTLMVHRIERPPVRHALVLAALAGAAYSAGRSNSRWCAPDSPLQLHGLWHVLSAGSALALAWRAAGPIRTKPGRCPKRSPA
jgi:hypothetical protein